MREREPRAGRGVLLGVAGLLLLGTLIGAAGGAPVSGAPQPQTNPTTLTFTAVFPNTRTDFALSRSVPQFNPALGQLTSVTIQNTSSITSQVRLNSTDSSPQSFTTTVTATLTLTGPGFSPLATTLSLPALVFNAAPYDGSADYQPPDGIDFGPRSAAGSAQTVISDTVQLAAYIGTGNVVFNEQATGDSSVVGSANRVTDISTSASSVVAVTYQYIAFTPTATPTATSTPTATPTATATFTPTPTSTPAPTSTPTPVPPTLTPTSIPPTATPVGVGSLSGFVYLDSNNNGVKEPGEPGIGGIVVVLDSVTPGQPVVPITSRSTAPDGSYQFSNLPSGTYSLTKLAGQNYLDGRNSAGSLGGTVVGNQITNIPVTAGAAGINYNFAQLLTSGPTPVVPELSPFVLFGSGLLLLAALARRGRRGR